MLLLEKDWPIGIMVRMFANGRGDQSSILGQVMPKTQENSTWCFFASYSSLWGTNKG